MKTISIPIILFSVILFSNCKKTQNKMSSDIYCDGLITDTLGTGDTARIYYPNAFTPNNDGLNDINRIIVKGISSITFTIYDSSNNIIFTTTQLNTPDPHGLAGSAAWAPTSNASTHETYYYKIQATTMTNNHIGVCGELYKLSCFPSSIPRSSVHFEDQLMIDGTFSAITLENLPDCP